MRSMRLLSLAGLACAALLAGCGGASDEDEIKQVVADYIKAVKDKDGDKLCDSIVSSELLAKSKDERAKDTERCKDDFSPKVFSDAPSLADDSEVGKVTVKGDKATANVTVTVNGRKERSKTEFVKVGGDWKLLFNTR